MLCACGRSLSIPTLRGLRELPTSPLDDATSLRSDDLSSSRKPSLALGLLFTVILLAVPVAIFFTYQRLRLDTSFTEQVDREQAYSHLESLPPDELSRTWNGFSTHGLGDPVKPAFYNLLQYARGLERIMITAWTIALIAAISAAIILVRRRERQENSLAHERVVRD